LNFGNGEKKYLGIFPLSNSPSFLSLALRYSLLKIKSIGGQFSSEKNELARLLQQIFEMASRCFLVLYCWLIPLFGLFNDDFDISFFSSCEMKTPV
jgi:hypothetical protein